jgi:hypothetical protein
MGSTNETLKEAIRRLPIPVLWQRLGLPGRVTERCCVRSPLRDDDRSPSFSIVTNSNAAEAKSRKLRKAWNQRS